MAKVNGTSKQAIVERKKQREILQGLGYYEYAYKFRIYPDKTQQEFLNKAVGCARFIYNQLLYLSEENYKNYGFTWNIYDYKRLLPELKKKYPFLRECPSQALQESVFCLDNAYKKYFTKEADKPVFKKKKNGGSIRIPQRWYLNYATGKYGELHIPKLHSGIKIRIHREIEGTLKSVAIVKEPSGRFYATISCIKRIENRPFISTVMGIDVGLKSYVTTAQINSAETSDGIKHEKVANPRHLKKSLRRLKRLNKQLSRKQHPKAKGDKTLRSKNFIKHSRKVAMLHSKVKNQRTDFLHKLSKTIIDDNQIIVVEDLNVKGMLQNEHLAQSLSDVSWSRFLRMLEYKALWYGRQIIKIGKFYPSSKLCFCGYRNNDLRLSDRKWTFLECGRVYDRDEHAADMVMFEGLRQLGWGSSKPLLVVGATPVETALVDDRIPLGYLKSYQSLNQEASY